MIEHAQAKLLVVDDDEGLRDILSEYLSSNGFTVRAVADGMEMRQALTESYPDALILDLMLPGENGLELTKYIRNHSNVPIIMLSARGEEIDRVIGLEVGVDDYLAKPFSPRELLARLRALLRRSKQSVDINFEESNKQIKFGPFSLDVVGRRLLKDGKEVILTSAEFNLLVAFAERPYRVISRDTIINILKGYERDPYDRSVDIRVARLRRKIEIDSSSPAFIRTIRGEGYIFNPAGQDK